MITAELFRNRDGLLTGFHISGHSGMADAGEDVLCAFVSSAAYMAANTITDIIGAPADAEVQDGDMAVTVNAGLEDCQIILEGLLLHLRATEEQYPDHLKTVCSVK